MKRGFATNNAEQTRKAEIIKQEINASMDTAWQQLKHGWLYSDLYQDSYSCSAEGTLENASTVCHCGKAFKAQDNCSLLWVLCGRTSNFCLCGTATGNNLWIECPVNCLWIIYILYEMDYWYLMPSQLQRSYQGKTSSQNNYNWVWFTTEGTENCVKAWLMYLI